MWILQLKYYEGLVVQVRSYSYKIWWNGKNNQSINYVAKSLKCVCVPLKGKRLPNGNIYASDISMPFLGGCGLLSGGVYWYEHNLLD